MNYVRSIEAYIFNGNLLKSVNSLPHLFYPPPLPPLPSCPRGDRVDLREALAGIDPKNFVGPTALAIGFDDEIAPAKVIFQYAKTHDALEIAGGITSDGTYLTATEVKALAQLPSREQLLGQLVGTIAAPLSGFVGVLGANVRSIVQVLSAISQLDSKE